MSERPFVLIVDDDPTEEASARLLERAGVDALHVLPNQLSFEILRRADLILVDEFIEHWDERDLLKSHPGLYVRDGISLAGVLRASLEERGPTSDDTPRASKTAIVLRTGRLDQLAAGTPAFMRSIAVAGRHDLEWVAEKSTTPVNALALLAHAAKSLPSTWNPSAPQEQLDWLGLLTLPWKETALAHIEECRPPWSTLAATSSGRRWMAWFLQRILPFPTFLVDDLRAASYLGLRPSALDQMLESASELSGALASSRYDGQLAEFEGRRWWRAGIAHLRGLLLEGTSGGMSDAVGRSAVEKFGVTLDELHLRHPVFEIDHDYRVVPEPLEITDAVRLQPDGWPVFADDPWLALKNLEHEPELRSLVVLDDRADDVIDAHT